MALFQSKTYHRAHCSALRRELH